MEQESTCRLVISQRHVRRARFQGCRGQIWKDHRLNKDLIDIYSKIRAAGTEQSRQSG